MSIVLMLIYDFLQTRKEMFVPHQRIHKARPDGLADSRTNN
jgi:hypothetical protein